MTFAPTLIPGPQTGQVLEIIIIIIIIINNVYSAIRSAPGAGTVLVSGERRESLGEEESL